jgi:hypothetical protein
VSCWPFVCLATSIPPSRLEPQASDPRDVTSLSAHLPLYLAAPLHPTHFARVSKHTSHHKSWSIFYFFIAYRTSHCVNGSATIATLFLCATLPPLLEPALVRFSRGRISPAEFPPARLTIHLDHSCMTSKSGHPDSHSNSCWCM